MNTMNMPRLARVAAENADVGFRQEPSLRNGVAIRYPGGNLCARSTPMAESKSGPALRGDHIGSSATFLFSLFRQT